MAIECLMCGEENPDGSYVCQNCGAQLQEETKVRTENEKEWKIICPKCGSSYNVSGPNDRINVCKCCHDEYDKQEIAGCIPIKVEVSEHECEENKTTYLILTELRRKEILRIKNSGIIGRIGDIDTDFFAADPYISEEHCKILHCGSLWQVEHIGHTNPTSLNGITLQHEVPMTLRDGDRLRIADLFFRVTFAEDIPEKNGKIIEKQKQPQWVIICPVCGKKYFGETSNFRVSECTGSCAYDDFDKYEIGKVMPSPLGE